MNEREKAEALQQYATSKLFQGFQGNQGLQGGGMGPISVAPALVRVCMFDGNKPVVVCGGEAKEAKDMDAAQALAESLAHSKGTDAYILKPVRKVAPKRDVVTTDLA